MEDKEKKDEVEERGWNISNWEEFRAALAEMSPRSKLFKTIQSELKKRGHWKSAPRGPWKKDK